MTWGIPLLISVAFGALALSPDPRIDPSLPWLVALIVSSLGAALWSERRRAPNWSPRAILLLAAVLRLLFLCRPPELSDDLHRYVWDGESVLAGRNPYAEAPAETELASPELRALRATVNHPELVTIYPPAAQLLFATGGLLDRALDALAGGAEAGLGLRGLLCALDLLACTMLLRFVRVCGLPPWRVALYAWHPLPVLEIAGSGHVDGAAVCFLLVSMALLAPAGGTLRRSVGSGVAFAVAVLSKLFPLALVPAALALAGRRRAHAFTGALIATTVGLCLPFLPELRNGLDTLGTYARSWEFASFPFRSLRRWTGSGDLSRALLAAAFGVTCLTLYARLARAGDRGLRSAVRASYGAAFAFLICSPTVHAWYALYLAALLPIAAGPAGLALTGSVFLGYRVLPRFARTGEWVDSDGAAFAIVAIPLGVHLLARFVRRRSRAHQSPPSGPE